MPGKSRSKPEGQKSSERTSSKQLSGTSSDKRPKLLALQSLCNTSHFESILTDKDVPKILMDVYVVGTNCYGELGLGGLTKKAEMPRPVLNSNLNGVIDVAAGGVHSVALTHTNEVYTWGVNDEGALGRNTTEEKKEENENDDMSVDSDEDEVTLNLKEATPLPVPFPNFRRGTLFCQVAASDSATFVLTTTGDVYGWGTFRASYSPTSIYFQVQYTNLCGRGLMEESASSLEVQKNNELLLSSLEFMASCASLQGPIMSSH